MKIKNKKTGEIDDYIFEVITDRIDLYRRVGHSGTKNVWHYNSLAELNAEWEDAPEEPKEYWYISDFGFIFKSEINDRSVKSTIEEMKSIGNYFETKEEAEKAVEKLKAWKRLKDAGLRFTAWKNGILLDETIAGQVRYEFPIDNKDDIEKDLDLLFGGGE